MSTTKANSSNDVFDSRKRKRIASTSSTKTHVQGFETLYFAEVWCEAQCAWIAVDVVNQQWNDLSLGELPPGRRFAYALTLNNGRAFDNTEIHAKDWAATYALRLQGDDAEWWIETLDDFNQRSRAQSCRKAPQLALRQERADEMARRTALASVPMPSRVADFKKHPIFVLGRHLTKYEAVHPSTTAGEFRGEPV